ncbi:MAG: hypothetical protein SGARI_002845 [Bacillariaceae sp.]
MTDEIAQQAGGFGAQANSVSFAPGSQEGNDVEGAPGPKDAGSAENSPASPKKEIPWGVNSSIRNGRDESVMADVDDMKNNCYFLFPDWKTRQSKFWILLILAAIIATAVIVAPLMMPIQGLMIATVLTNKKNWFFSLFMVCMGVGSVILVGFLFGLFADDNLFLPENNDQVSSRINPALTDLIAALATGMVGAISLVRKDIAGALPGVAISISLVPPLAVVGLMLSIKYGQDAGGAMLLFTTNFLCIMVMGIITMYVYGVHQLGNKKAAKYRATVFLVVLLALGFTAVPLYFSSKRLGEEANAKKCLEDYINFWGAEKGWRAQVVVARSVGTRLEASATIIGPPPFPELDDLTGEGVQEVCPTVNVVEVSFFPAKHIEL